MYAWLDWILGHGRRFGGELPAGVTGSVIEAALGGYQRCLR